MFALPPYLRCRFAVGSLPEATLPPTKVHPKPLPLKHPTKDRGEGQKRMAILTGINTRLRGSAGEWTFTRLGGRTVAKQKVERKEIPSRTFAQMRHRVRWANLVNLFRAFTGTLHPSFESRPQGVSDFNMFISSNIGGSPVYLTSQEATQGGAVVAPYQITRGSLPSVEVVANGPNGEVGTDISLGSLTIGESTTLKQFSDAVVNNNANYQNGDQISCFVAKQSTNSVTGVPYVEIDAYEVVAWHTSTAARPPAAPR